ncbi:MAG TPA: response regulator [Thermoanaerobaculia bacterium]|jgi:two-component system response regulator ResD
MIRLLGRKSRVLLLDDDPSMQRLVSTLLRRKGHRVDVVDGGRKAIEKLDEEKYDVILLDIMTPTEGGVTVIKHLKEKSPETLKRVILVTGSPGSILKNIEGDVFAVVHKPFDAQQLLETIDRLTQQ